jgi:hypothetical protein
LLFFATAHAEQRRFINSSPSKTAVTFPETIEGQIAIQTGAGQYEVLSFMEEDGHAIAQTCETEMKKPCKAQDLKSYFSKSQKELSERCTQSQGESRIARRHGVKKITSVCYFKEDKSFVEFN